MQISRRRGAIADPDCDHPLQPETSVVAGSRCAGGRAGLAIEHPPRLDHRLIEGHRLTFRPRRRPGARGRALGVGHVLVEGDRF